MIKISANVNMEQLKKKLTWDNFQGEIDPSSPYSAFTYWNVGYTISSGRDISVSISIRVSPKSWAKSHARTKELLMHEKGHHRISKLLALRFKRKVDGFFFDGDYQNTLADIFGLLHTEALELEEKYDRETCHYKNVDAQRSWNNFLKSAVNSLISKLE